MLKNIQNFLIVHLLFTFLQGLKYFKYNESDIEKLLL